VRIGEEIEIEIQIYRIAGGRIAERWFVVDRSDLQQDTPASRQTA
jgi:predicted ester cyclase